MDQMTSSDTNKKSLDALRNRLLDLTGRNKLLNFKYTKTSSLRIIDELPDQLKEVLISEKELSFIPIPDPREEELIEAGYLKVDEETEEVIKIKDNPTAVEWAKWLELNTSYELPEPSVSEENHQKHQDNDIQTLMFAPMLEASLRGIHSKAKSAIEETGANVLYITFGMLEWFESKDSDLPRIAPLFLIPLSIAKGKLNKETNTYQYTIKYSGEDIISNLSLSEKLKIDFGLALPNLDEETQPEEYFNEINNLIKQHQPTWKIRRHAALALLNFSKLLMYLDLDPDRWPEGSRITEHPIVSQFFNGTEEKVSENAFDDEYEIDELEEVHTKYPLIYDADSSQHSAIVDAVEGKSMVIEGPPGTGKSQTITNIIAAALGQNKSVLFVAEKMAALEVVKDKLDKAGLGDFCLELHSHKTQKKKILEDLKIRDEKHRWMKSKSKIENEIAKYESTKEKLSEYAVLINKKWKNTGKTINEILTSATRYRLLCAVDPKSVCPDDVTGDSQTLKYAQEQIDTIETYLNIFQSIAERAEGNNIYSHPWYGVENKELQIYDTDKVVSFLVEWQGSIETLIDFVQKLSTHISDVDVDGLSTLDELADFSKNISKITYPKNLNDVSALAYLKDDVLIQAKEYLSVFKSIQSILAEITPKILERIKISSEFEQGLSAILADLGKYNIDENLTIDDIKSQIQLLTKTLPKVDETFKLVEQVKTAIGSEFETEFPVSVEGLKNFQSFLYCVNQFDTQYEKFRSSLFDNPNIDDVLPELEREIIHLKEISNNIEFVNFAGLPSHDEVSVVVNTLKNSSLFSWFSSQWRESRKNILSIVKPATPFKKVLACLDDVLEYSKRNASLLNNTKYKDALSELFSGIETDFNKVKSLRKWYRAVREQYGIGFGDKVQLGEKLLSLPVSTVTAIKSLEKQGVTEKINNIATSISNVYEILGLKEDLSKITISSTESYLQQVLSLLNQYLNKATSIYDENITIEQFENLEKHISSLNIKIAEWGAVKTIEDSLDKKFHLNIDEAIDANTEQVSQVINYAQYISNEVSNNGLRSAFYNNSNIEFANQVINYSKELSGLLIKEKESLMGLQIV